jgi:hypothetical protein
VCVCVVRKEKEKRERDTWMKSGKGRERRAGYFIGLTVHGFGERYKSRFIDTGAPEL